MVIEKDFVRGDGQAFLVDILKAEPSGHGNNRLWSSPSELEFSFCAESWIHDGYMDTFYGWRGHRGLCNRLIYRFESYKENARVGVPGRFFKLVFADAEAGGSASYYCAGAIQMTRREESIVVVQKRERDTETLCPWRLHKKRMMVDLLVGIVLIYLKSPASLRVNGSTDGGGSFFSTEERQTTRTSSVKRWLLPPKTRSNTVAAHWSSREYGSAAELRSGGEHDIPPYVADVAEEPVGWSERVEDVELLLGGNVKNRKEIRRISRLQRRSTIGDSASPYSGDISNSTVTTRA
ncbi:hypothetical protein IW261DRAFT_1598318 [Armillaria novae-zelandiae]|uniref:Uncharacterized protein n=1 Tax=Armillaria novae-zelandiae TaxID=153914 RepID=A0AA39T5W5_9AGAR|nr:hypothetical protein IW261DRAFT_1598318 [Armillaria novae-zelandiae]